jgi:CHAD domain-containing protein
VKATHLLGRPAPEATRLLALGHLEDAARASTRLGNAKDEDALHDFRVALRRLRSCLRAYRRPLRDALKKRHRAELRELAAATGGGRDAEVQIEWLRKQASALEDRERVGLTWLVDRLEQRKAAAYQHIRGPVAVEFQRLHERLTRGLSVYEAHVQAGPVAVTQTFAHATAIILSDFALDLRARLALIQSAADGELQHEARISAKRLRYLVEPLKEALPGAHGVIAQVKALQELLGELHDAMVLGQEIVPAVEAAGAEGARRLHERALEPTPLEADLASGLSHDAHIGLLAVARLQRERLGKLFARLDADWLGERAQPLFQQLDRLAQALLEQPLPRGGRLFVLRERPGLTARRETTVEEGFLPGESVFERLVRVRDGEVERLYRQISLEEHTAQEECDTALWHALWPLTVGRRVHFRRLELQDPHGLWEIREYTDRHLVLAEALAPPTARPPDWLAPLVIDEVTGQPGYRAEQLTARKAAD